MPGPRREKSEASVIQMPRRNRISFEDLERYFIFGLLGIIGFLLTFTLYDFRDTLKQVRGDISSLQTSFSALAQHVSDEDRRR